MPVSAALVPGCGTAGNPCTACHFIVLGQNILNYLTSIMVVVAITLITAMGVLYIISAGNDGMTKRAKEGLKAVLIGIVIMLTAWLMVNTVLLLVANPAFIKGGQGGFLGLTRSDGSFGLQCSTTSLGGIGHLAGSPGVAGGGNGTCSPITDAGNSCSTANLQSTCFSSNVNTWSSICSVESSGGTPIQSKTDVCTNLGNRSFSGGLFQINILANGSTLDATRCNDIGKNTNCNKYNSTGACVGWTCTSGTDYANWDYCMGLTMNANTNIKAACEISKNGTYTQPWPHTAQTVCGLPVNI